MRTAGGFLFGRRTYEIFARYWPKVTDPANELAAALNSRPKYVASTSLTSVDWAATTVLRDDVASRAATVARDLDGDLVVLGSSVLAQSLMRDDVIDRYQLWLHPVVLGGGKRLFVDGTPRMSLRLAGSQVTDDGLVILDYERAANGQPAGP